MRSPGAKDNLVKTLKEETNVVSYPCLPKEHRITAVVVDAMYAIRRWTFHKEEPFGSIATRYRKNLIQDVPAGTSIIHFCCDRYNPKSPKSSAQQHRYAGSRSARLFEVSEQYRAPDPHEFFSVAANKAELLNFLCETWSNEEQLTPTLGLTRLYLGGGFKEETKCGSVTNVSDLESTQQEADTRVILHTIYSVEIEDVDRIIIHANDTYIIVMCVYYACTLLSNLTELWVRTAPENYLTIHEMCAALGPARCRALPFLHSLSGRDTTSYPYFTGKKMWVNRSKTTDVSALGNFAEQDHTQTYSSNSRRNQPGQKPNDRSVHQERRRVRRIRSREAARLQVPQ